MPAGHVVHMHVPYPRMLRANHHGCEYVLMAVQADLFMGTAKPPKSHLKTTLYSKSESDQDSTTGPRPHEPARKVLDRCCTFSGSQIVGEARHSRILMPPRSLQVLGLVKTTCGRFCHYRPRNEGLTMKKVD